MDRFVDKLHYFKKTRSLVNQKPILSFEVYETYILGRFICRLLQEAQFKDCDSEQFKPLRRSVINWEWSYFARNVGWIAYFIEARRLCRENLTADSLLQIEYFVNDLFTHDGVRQDGRFQIDDRVMTRFFIAYKILQDVRKYQALFCQHQFELADIFYKTLYNLVAGMTNNFDHDVESDAVDIDFFYRMRDLIDRPEIVFATEDEFGGGYLHIGAKHGDVFHVQMLIAAGMKVDALDGTSLTPLHYAAYYNSLDVAKILILCGAKLNEFSITGFFNEMPNVSFSPIGLALVRGNFNIVNLLIKYGVTPNI